MRMFGQTNAEEKNGQPLVTPDMDGRFYQTVTAVPAIVLEDSPKSADVKRSTLRTRIPAISQPYNKQYIMLL